MLNTEEINGMLVNQLKEELKTRGASTAGKKADLCARLIECIANETHVTEPVDTEAQETEVAAVLVDDSDKERISSEGNQKEEAEANAPAPDRSEPLVTAIENATGPNDRQSAEDLSTVNDSEVVGSGSAQAGTSLDKVFELSPSEASAAPITESTTEAEEEQNREANEPQTHVRIDNFQRPLNQKALLEWIETQCGCKLAPEGFWINSIKTHCYVDFASHEDAKRCVQKITGQRYPASSPYTLVADFTGISAKDAPTAPEAARKPGEWKNAIEEGADKDQMTVDVTGSDTAKDTSSPRMQVQSSPAGGTASGRKRPIEDSTPEDGAVGGGGSAVGSPTAAAATGPEGGGKSRRLLGGLDIFRRAAAGILLGKPGAGSGGGAFGSVGHQPGRASEDTPTVAGLVSRGTGEAGDSHAEAGRGGGEGEEGTAASAASKGYGLDDLFRKTTKTKPALYWLPAPDELVQQRLKDRLKAKGGMGSRK